MPTKRYRRFFYPYLLIMMKQYSLLQLIPSGIPFGLNIARNSGLFRGNVDLHLILKLIQLSTPKHLLIQWQFFIQKLNMAKTLKMLRYLFISFFLFVLLQVKGQTKSANWEPSQGITVGVNLAGPINKVFNNYRTGLSFLTRISVKEKILFLGEAGYEKVFFEEEKYHYSSNGTFLKAGFEYDVLGVKEAGSNDNLLFGLHYGLAIQEHGAPHFMIENGYWNIYTGDIGIYTVNTHWLEISGGPRMELFKNLYLGWTFQIKVSIINDNPDILSPYFIPGFGNGDNRINAGFSYYVEYMIPWKKAGLKK